jgi:hypothetical protein
MNIVELPKANSAVDIEVGIKATDELYVPGFLISPVAMSDALGGIDMMEFVKSFEPYSNGSEVSRTNIDILRPILEGMMGLDVDDEIVFSAMQHSVDSTQVGNSHTDKAFHGGTLWFCTAVQDNLPRELTMATTYQSMKPIGLELEKMLPKYVKTMFKGVADIGWAAYLLAKSVESYPGGNAPRTAHRVRGGGAYARFGERDEEGVRVKQAELRRLALVG